MKRTEFAAEKGGERLDKFLSLYEEGLTRSYAQKLIEDECVLVNGKCVPSKYKVCEGDRIIIEYPKADVLELTPEDIPLDIVYEDDSVIVINKPAGMVVHPAAGNLSGTLVNALLMHSGDSLSTINGVHRPGIVHRLDKDTSGLLIVAKGDAAHQSLSEQLKTRTLKRQYTAIVHGNIKEDSGTINKNIARSTKDRKKMEVTKIGGRVAITNFAVKERFGRYTLVECNLDTGRTHQIRVHMKSLGHPILGDKTYGIKKEEFNLTGQMLHAEKIGFIHPKTGEYMSFSAKAPEVFKKTLEIIRERA